MNNIIYSDEFLGALGAWQAGWREEKDRRVAITDRLRAAINASSLPEEAFRVPFECYRKRFLVPNNPQNGGDFWPFFWDGEIAEGIASWTTDYNYCRVIFKKYPRPESIACIFKFGPQPSEVVLNIAALWHRADFRSAVFSYIDRKKENFSAIQHFRDTQSEVILDASLTMDDVVAFCGQVPSLDRLCSEMGITTPEDEDDLWRKLVEANLLPTFPYWLEGDAAQRAIDHAIIVIQGRLRQWLKPKP
jgi:hypothetical protein